MSDDSALGAVFDAHYARIYRYCAHRLFRAELAEDVTSAVFLDLARRFDEISRRDEPEIMKWLYGTANNHITSYFRSEKRRNKAMQAAYRKQRSNITTDNSANSEIDWPTLYQALMRLSVKHRTIVTLRFLDGLSADQVADILEIKPGAVRTTAHRALKKLKTILEPQKAQYGGSA